MATTVYEKVTIELGDGSELEMQPLKIKLLREFMTEFEKINQEDIASDNIKSMDLLLECAVIAFKQYRPEDATTEKLEDLLDLPTVYKVIEVASGIKLDDPNALAAALTGAN